MRDSVGTQRADADYEIVFDGGSLSNPGHGYGSYRLRGADLPSRIVRLEFGDGVTNNEAEYRALIEGLADLVQHLDAKQVDLSGFSVLAAGDSQLVISQVTGRWKIKSQNLVPLAQRARALLSRFGRTELRWHPRINSVRILGH